MTTLARPLDNATVQNSSTSRLTPETMTMRHREAIDPSEPHQYCERPISAIPEREQAPRVSIAPALIPRARSKAAAKAYREAIEAYLAASRARFDAFDVITRANNAGASYEEETRLEDLEHEASKHEDACQ